MNALPSLNGSIGYIFSSCDLDLKSSGDVRFKDVVERFKVFGPPKRPEGKAEEWLAGERVDTRGELTANLEQHENILKCSQFEITCFPACCTYRRDKSTRSTRLDGLQLLRPLLHVYSHLRHLQHQVRWPHSHKVPTTQCC